MNTRIKAPTKADICKKGMISFEAIKPLVTDHVVVITADQFAHVVKEESSKVRTLFGKLTYLSDNQRQIALYAGVGSIPAEFAGWNRYTNVSYGVAHNNGKWDRPWISFQATTPTKTNLLARIFAPIKLGTKYPLGKKPISFRLAKEKEQLVKGHFYQIFDGNISPLNIKKDGKTLTLDSVIPIPGHDNPIVFKTVDNEEYRGTLDVATHQVIALPQNLTF